MSRNDYTGDFILAAYENEDAETDVVNELLSRMEVAMSTTKYANRKPLNGKFVSQNFERGRKNLF